MLSTDVPEPTHWFAQRIYGVREIYLCQRKIRQKQIVLIKACGTQRGAGDWRSKKHMLKLPAISRVQGTC